MWCVCVCVCVCVCECVCKCVHAYVLVCGREVLGNGRYADVDLRMRVEDVRIVILNPHRAMSV